MELVPGWIPILTISAAVFLLFIMAIAGSLTRQGRAASGVGMKFAMRSLGPGIARGLPVALLVGIFLASLSVGDGLLKMVEENTAANLSGVDIMISAPGYVPEALMERAGIGDIEGVDSFCSLILLDGIGTELEGGSSVGIKLMAVDDDDLEMLGAVEAESSDNLGAPPRYGCYVNRELSKKLEEGSGGGIRISVPSFSTREESLLGFDRSDRITLNLTVEAVIENRGIGRFRTDSLAKVEPILVVDIGLVQERLGIVGKVNTVLIDTVSDGGSGKIMDSIMSLLDDAVGLDEAGFRVVGSLSSGGSFIYSDGLFFDETDLTEEGNEGLSLSYFVDSLASGNGELSYSVVSGVRPGLMEELEMIGPQGSGPLPGTGEIAVNNWTAERMGLSIGDDIVVSYRKVTLLGELREEERTFRVAAVYNMTGIGMEPGFLPPIEGVTDAPSCNEWDPSFDLDLDSLGEADLEYWDIYRTTPKCFVSLEDAREMWAGSYGDSNALLVRGEDVQGELDNIGDGLDHSSMGISLVPVRERALESSRAMLIFPGMFLSFGTVMIAGALLTLYAVIKDMAARRSHEWGILRSIGAGRRGLFQAALVESAWSIVAGSLIGLPVGFVFSFVLNAGLSSAWSDSVENSSVPFSVSAGTVLISISIGVISSMVLSLIAVWRETGSVPAVNLREEDISVGSPTMRGRLLHFGASGASIIIGIALLVSGSGSDDIYAKGLLFTLGSIVFSAGTALLIYLIASRVSRRSDLLLIVSANITRRPRKHPLTISILAMALTISLSLTVIGAMLEADAEDGIGDYGGGFDYVVELPVPFRGELRSGAMDVESLLSVGSEGGTCSNVNAVYPPRLLGVREGFSNVSGFGLMERRKGMGSDKEAWEMLHSKIDGRIPILVDQNTLAWIYYEKLGSEFKLDTENGERVTLVVVGVLESSVFTGSFVLSSTFLKDLFPSTAAPDYFLVRANGGGKEAVEGIFEDFSPLITPVRDLALENARYELSYLYLFRDFLLLGVILSLASAVVFTHARAVDMRKEISLLRTIGAPKGRSVMYFLLENLAVFMIALLGAIAGSAAGALVFFTMSDSAFLTPDMAAPIILIPGGFLLASLVIGIASSMWAVKGYDAVFRR